MNLKNEMNKPKGYFSTYSFGCEHKQRLENFIKRNKPLSPRKEKSSSPVVEIQKKEKKLALGAKELVFVEKEKPLKVKEQRFVEKEKVLNKFDGVSRPKIRFPSFEDTRISPSPISKKEILLTAKVINMQMEALITAEAEIDQLRQKISSTHSSSTSKLHSLEKSLKDLKQSYPIQKSSLVKSLCKEIILGLIPQAICQSTLKSSSTLDARQNALQVSIQKMKKLENKLKSTKESLEKQALNLLSHKNILYEKSVKIQEKAESIETLSASLGKSERAVIQMAESFKKREDLLALRLGQISCLEKQIQDQELSLLAISKKRSESADRPSKLVENPFLLRENAVKAKENELNVRRKEIEEKKNAVLEVKSKIKWRLNNIVSLERRSEKIKQNSENKAEEFENFVKQEEKMLQLWREKVKNKELVVNQLRNKCKDLENRLKNFNENRDYEKDSIEEFQVIEKEVEVSNKVEKFTDFAKRFQLRQAERRKEYQEISKEKKELSEKISSILKFQ